jgi:hypothetical protein
MIAPGTRFGSYAITAMLGAGAMGEVYRATEIASVEEPWR